MSCGYDYSNLITLYSVLLTSYDVWAWQRDNFFKSIFI